MAMSKVRIVTVCEEEAEEVLTFDSLELAKSFCRGLGYGADQYGGSAWGHIEGQPFDDASEELQADIQGLFDAHAGRSG